MFGKNGKVAIYGAGKAADIYCRSASLDYDVFTTDGQGAVGEKKAMSISELNAQSYEFVIIASDFAHEMLNNLKSIGVPEDKIYFFEYESKQVIPLQQISKYKSKVSILYCIYDLAVNHPSYDIIHFLILAEQERVKLGFDGIYLVVVPSNTSNGATFKALIRYNEQSEIEWRIQRLVCAASSLLKSCIGHAKLASRSQINSIIKEQVTFPHNFDPDAPQKTFEFVKVINNYSTGLPIDVLRASVKAKAYISSYLRSVCPNKKPVVVTLREYSHEPKRNSDLDSWRNFLHWLNSDVYYPIIVRDTNKAFEMFDCDLNLYERFSLASIDIDFRMALYEGAYLNLTVDTGPFELMLASETIPYINFKLVDEEYIGSDENFAKNIQGIPIGSKPPWSGKHQMYVWKKETFNEIKNAFQQWLSVNE